MAIEITVPRLGWSMEEGVFVGWLKRDGDLVRAGDPLFTLQGEKATQDVEAIDGGTLRIEKSAPVVGDTVLVGAIIGYLVQTGESDPPRGLPQADTLPKQASHPEVPRSSPLARRIAREHGIDWTQLVGSGSSGRIRRADVLEAVRDNQSRTPRRVAAREGSALPGRSIAVSPTRRTIAGRMSESRRLTAPVTLTTTVDLTNLVGLRRQFKAAEQPGIDVPSFLDFTVKLTALALRDHPLLNASWSEGTDQIDLSEHAHIGIAVDTEAGLVVPVIHNADGLGIRQIASLARELIHRAREGQLRPDDIQGGTFTVTNLGAFGVETFTPIIRPPECAILGMGTIERRPVMEADQVVGRDLMNLSLTFDHRIVDGAPAARFLQQLAQFLKNPAPWLMA